MVNFQKKKRWAGSIFLKLKCQPYYLFDRICVMYVVSLGVLCPPLYILLKITSAHRNIFSGLT